MFVSAFWHGIHPGYFLSFLTIPLCTAAEDTLFKVVTADENGKRPMWFQFMLVFIIINIIDRQDGGRSPPMRWSQKRTF
jgi:hypothetical protein